MSQKKRHRSEQQKPRAAAHAPETAHVRVRRRRLPAVVFTLLGAAVVVGAVVFFPRLKCSNEQSAAPLTVPAAIPSTAAGPGLNVLLITLDGIRADHLGCYGATHVKTPALDLLAAQGLRFEQAVTAAPMTLPSHASIMTGLYPPRHGIRDDGPFRLDAKHETLAESLQKAGYQTAAFVASFRLDRRWGLAQGFDHHADDLSSGRKLANEPMDFPSRPGNLVIDEAIGWFQEHHRQGAERRFFAWIHLLDADASYTPPEPYATDYAENPYLGKVAFVDAQVGRIIDFLAQQKMVENTLTLVLGSYGQGLGEHQEETHGLLLYDTTVRVPMIWKSPSIATKPKVVVDRIVGTVDVFPTILDLLELPAPPTLNGISLVRTVPADRAMYVEAVTPQLQHGWSPLFAMRGLNDKLIDAPTPEYYDLQADPKESNNGFDGDRPRVAELQNLLKSQLTSFGRLASTSTAAVVPESGVLEQFAAMGYTIKVSGAPAGKEQDPKAMIADYGDRSVSRKLVEAARFDEASAKCWRILERSPSDGPVLARLGFAWEQQGLFEDALKATVRAVELQPYERHWLALAGLQWRRGDFDAAELSLAQLARIDAADGEIPIFRGRQALADRKYEEAIRFFEEARRLDPSRQTANSYALTGDVFMAQKMESAAKGAYEKALSFDPYNDTSLLALADMEQRAGRVSQEAAHLRRLCMAKPSRMLYTNRLAQMYLQTERPDEAIDLLKDFAARNPDSHAALGNLGNALSEAGHPLESMAAYEAALALAPDYAYARLNLASALSRTGDPEAAIEQYRKLLTIHPGHGAAALRLVRVLTSQGRVDEAFQTLEVAAAHAPLKWQEMTQDPFLEALVGDPRFEQLRRQYERQ